MIYKHPHLDKFYKPKRELPSDVLAAKVTQQKFEQGIELYKEGLSITKSAEKAGVNRAVLSLKIKERDIKQGDYTRDPTKRTRGRMKELKAKGVVMHIDNGLSVVKTARALNISANTLYVAVKEHRAQLAQSVTSSCKADNQRSNSFTALLSQSNLKNAKSKTSTAKRG